RGARPGARAYRSGRFSGWKIVIRRGVSCGTRSGGIGSGGRAIALPGGVRAPHWRRRSHDVGGAKFGGEISEVAVEIAGVAFSGESVPAGEPARRLRAAL